MIKQYFQKSYAFVYPLLGIQSKRSIKPIMTYLHCGNGESHNLICIYEVRNHKFWDKFNDTILTRHIALKSIVQLSDELSAYIFDMTHFKDDYDLILQGKYSKLSKEIKKAILSYYDINNFTYTQIELCLFPEKLNKHEELCDKPDMEKEVYVISEEAIVFGEFLKK